jgi:hypothetical protein
MPPTGGVRPRHSGIARVIVAGATSTSASARAAETLATALAAAFNTAGFDSGSVAVVHAGAQLDGVLEACEAGAFRFVVVTGVAKPMLAAAFAMVKAIQTRQPDARIEILVTGQDESRAHGAYSHVRSAVARFLGRDVGFAGAFTDPDLQPAVGADGEDSPGRRSTRVSRAARIWAARLLAECSEGAWPEATHLMN